MLPLAFAREHLDVRVRPEGTVIARPLHGFDGYCHFYSASDGCTVHAVKPAGGRDFECWSPERCTPGRERMFFITKAEVQRHLLA
jgi:hypothetical protein